MGKFGGRDSGNTSVIKGKTIYAEVDSETGETTYYERKGPFQD